MARLGILRRLAALNDAPPPPRWWHWVVGLDFAGRLTLPAEARQLAADRAALVRASSQGNAVVFRREGLGAPTLVDRRGRVRLPGWLCRQVGPAGTMLVAARRPAASIVVVTAASGLDDLADAFAGEVG